MHEEQVVLSRRSKISSDPTVIAAEMAAYHVADAVEALNALRPRLAASVLEHMAIDRVTDILEQPGFDNPQEIIEQLPLDRAATIVGAMSADRRADIFRRLSESARVRLSPQLEPSTQSSLQRLLAYPPMSAGSIMTTEFVSMPATWTVEQALQLIYANRVSLGLPAKAKDLTEVPADLDQNFSTVRQTLSQTSIGFRQRTISRLLGNAVTNFSRQSA